ncbi:MAG: hypothetical protein SV775_11070, partial [Thermodesulfobacteriota bacterium]|nr:hypothetical protein [Thermodesulfobacteriota bacterium]
MKKRDARETPFPEEQTMENSCAGMVWDSPYPIVCSAELMALFVRTPAISFLYSLEQLPILGRGFALLKAAWPTS